MTILYHTSSRCDLSIIKPQRTLSKDKYIGDYIFATSDKILAIMYLTTKGNYSLMNPHSRPPSIVIRSDETSYRKTDKGGTIYTLPSKSFQKTPQTELSDFERVSIVATKPLDKTTYKNSLDAMQAAGIEIYFTNQHTFDELVKAKGRQQDKLISQLKPYIKN